LLARRVADLWSGTPGGSIVQFIKIPPDDEECLLYSMSIALNLDLTLLLERKTSLTTARRRAQEFQRALGKPPGTGTLKRATGDLARKPGGKTPTGGLGSHGA
jgi:hypothetical protein